MCSATPRGKHFGAFWSKKSFLHGQGRDFGAPQRLTTTQTGFEGAIRFQLQEAKV